MTASSYDEALKRVLVHEGGYSDHPSDPGGPTNWGITIHDARAYWRKDATAADVRNMPIDVAKDIYRSKYWDAMRCDDLPAGVDYAVFDYGVNSGIARAAKVLQRFVGANVDGEIGPDTIAATAPADAAELINQICDERLAFLQSLRTWGVFGNGWGRRVREVRAAAVSMAGAARHDGASPPSLATMREISGTREYSGSADNPAILGWARFIGEKYPEMRSYCAQYNHDAIAWCGLTVLLPRQERHPAGVRQDRERTISVGRRLAKIRSSPRQTEARLRDGLYPQRQEPCGVL
jgi:lysozyme family protein